MANLKETASNYVAPVTKNISELDKVPVTLDLKNKVVNEGTQDEFSYNYVIVDEEEYRVPNSVLKQLKAQITANDELEYFMVQKEGEGLKTEYTVIPLINSDKKK